MAFFPLEKNGICLGRTVGDLDAASLHVCLPRTFSSALHLDM